MLNKLCLVSVPKQSLCAVCFVPSRSCTIDIKEIKSSQTAQLKRGTGGRSSFNGNVVTVFGASGFMGRHICNQLGKRGAQIIIPHRSDADECHLKNLKLVGDLGQVIFHPFDLRDPTSIKKAVKYSNIVINLIGSWRETRNFSFFDVHEKGAKEIAKACRESNVERLIHFSTLNVNEEPKRYYLKKLNFLPSKKKGEIAVLNEFPDATIFRPAPIYGFSDRFFGTLLERKRSFLLSVPLYKKGEETIKQPVFAGDVSLAVMNAIDNYETAGKIYQIVGPERFFLRDIVIFCSQILQRHEHVSKLIHDIKFDPFFLAKMLFWHYGIGFFQYYPFHKISPEQIELESMTDVVDPDLPVLNDLGVKPSKLEDKLPHLIYVRYQALPHFGRMYDDLNPADSLSKKAIRDF